MDFVCLFDFILNSRNNKALKNKSIKIDIYSYMDHLLFVQVKREKLYF